MNEIGSLVYKIEADLKSVQRALETLEARSRKTANKVEKHSKAMSASMNMVNKAGKALMTLGIGAMFLKIGKESAEAASDLEETSSKFDVVFGDVSEAAQDMAEKLQESYAMSEVESKKLLSNTGDLLTGFGMTGDAALDLSSKTQMLAADLASFSNVEGGVKRASEALTKAYFGEREMLKELGIVITETTLQERLKAKGLDKLTGQALLQAKAQETIAMAMEKSKNALGDFARTSDSFANTQRAVLSRLQDVAANIGKEFLPALRNLMSSFMDATDEGGVLAFVFAKIGQSISFTLNGIATLVAGIQELVVAAKRLKSEWELSMDPDYVFSVEERRKKEEEIADLAAEQTRLSEKRKMFAMDLVVSYDRLLDFGGELVEDTEKTEENIKNSNDPAREFADDQERAATASGKMSKNSKETETTFGRLSKHLGQDSPMLMFTGSYWDDMRSKYKEATDVIQEEFESGHIKFGEYATRMSLAFQGKIGQMAVDVKNALNALAEPFMSTFGVITDSMNMEFDMKLQKIEETYKLATRAMDNHYNQEKQRILDSQKSEEEKAAAIENLESRKEQQSYQLKLMYEQMKHKIEKRQFEVNKKLRIAETIMSGANAAMNVIKSFSLIPFVGFPLGLAAAAAIGIYTGKMVSMIAKQNFPALAEGGLATGTTMAMIGEGSDDEVVAPLNNKVYSRMAQGIVGELSRMDARKRGGVDKSSVLGGGNERINLEARFEIPVMLDGQELVRAIDERRYNIARSMGGGDYDYGSAY